MSDGKYFQYLVRLGRGVEGGMGWRGGGYNMPVLYFLASALERFSICNK